MAQWRFEHLSEADARKVIEARDYSLDTQALRILAQRILDRRYADDGKSAPPLRYFERCSSCRGRKGGCGFCGRRGYVEIERPHDAG